MKDFAIHINNGIYFKYENDEYTKLIKIISQKYLSSRQAIINELMCCMQKKPEVWNRELSEIKIDQEELVKNSNRYRIGSVRLALGRVCTQKQFDEVKQRILRKPLP